MTYLLQGPCHADLEAFGAATAAVPALHRPTFDNTSPVAIPLATSRIALESPRYARAHSQPGMHPPLPAPRKELSSLSNTSYSVPGDWTPSTSVEENEFGWCLQVILPGVKVKDIRVELMPGNRLYISGTRHSMPGAASIPDVLSTLPEVFGLPTGSAFRASLSQKDMMLSGGFQIVWTIPADANLESLQAEVMVGITCRSLFVMIYPSGVLLY